MPRNGSITTRLIALLTLCAAVIIGIGMLVDYRLSRNEILERLQRESRDTVRSVVIDMENWLEGVEGATLLLSRIVQQREYSEAGLKQMLRDAVEVNADIFGASIALAPGQAGTDLGFAPYYFRRDGKLAYASLAGADHNYQEEAWFTDAVAAGQPLWVEPYFDEAGGKVLMTTFAVPVYRQDAMGKRFLYAVVTADVALAELHNYLQRLGLGASGFGILLSRNGIFLSTRDPANIMQHYSRAAAAAPDQATWQEMFNAALEGQVITRQVACIDVPGNCVIRLGSLASTGWPVGVVYSEHELTSPLREFQLKTGVTGLLTLLLMALAVIVVSRRLTRPLGALALATRRIAQGDLEAPLPKAQGSDEVAGLIDSFAAMKQDLKSYIADLEAAAARRSRLEGELGAAREIQMAMLPQGGEASELQDAYSLWARVLPARSVGGDLYYYHRSDRMLVVAVGDVSDKGVPAALFMARAISLIQQLAASTIDPAAAMASLNTALETGNENCMFVTLFLGVLDLDSLELRFSSAGHTTPSLARNAAVTPVAQQQGPALGLAPGLAFPCNSLQLQAGDRLAIFTDGIDEAFNDQDQMFGVDRFNEALLNSLARPGSIAGAEIFDVLARFAGGTPQSDDISLLLLDIANGKTASTRMRSDFTRGPGLTGRVQAWLNQVLAPLALPGQVLGDLMLVTEEIVSNIDKYAGLAAQASIALAVEVDARQLVIEVRDEGTEFNPLVQARRAHLGSATEEASIGGLGVHLITSLTERQSYRREQGCNILRVTKLLGNQPV